MMIEAPEKLCPPTLVALSGIEKRFSNGVVALQGLDLTLRRGEFVSLLGPSGCGKSTVLRLIAGLAEPTEGAIHRESARPIGSSPPAHRAQDKVGFVFQEPTLMPWRTVLGNVALPLRLAGMHAAEARAAAQGAIARVGLGDFAAAYPRQLSGGMKMRVSLARALVTDPSLLLMDEPFAALDEITRFKLNEDVLKVWAEGRLTSLFVTHSVFESVFLSTRILVMAVRPGRVVAEIPIGASYPRGEAFRTSAEYNHYARVVSAALHSAMGQPSGPHGPTDPVVASAW